MQRHRAEDDDCPWSQSAVEIRKPGKRYLLGYSKMFEEWWASRDDLNKHLRSEAYRRVILVMELAAEYPFVRFSEITKTTGMETIRNSRFGPLPGME